MAILPLAGNMLEGLSSDSKPTNYPAGTRFFETDTGDLLYFDGGYWWLQSAGIGSKRRWGSMGMSNASPNTGTGLLQPTSSGTGTGSPTVVMTDLTNGRYTRWPTLTVSGNKGGVRTTTTQTIRGFNPRMRARFKLEDTVLHRMTWGFVSSGEPTGDDPLVSTSGIYFGLRSASTNFIIQNNDAGGVTPTPIDTGVAKDTNVHEFKIVADDANSRWSWSVDGSSYSHITTDIPAQTTAMGIVLQNETAEAAAKAIDLFHVWVQSAT